MNLLNQLGLKPVENADFDRELGVYLGANGTLLLFGFAGTLRNWLYFASLSRADDTAQNEKLLEELMYGKMRYAESAGKVLKALGLSWQKLSDDWYALEPEKTPEDERAPEPYAKVIRHAIRLLTAEARLRAGDDAYRSTADYVMRQCETVSQFKTRDEVAPLFGALNRIVIADRCMLLTEDAKARENYLAMRKAVKALDALYFDLPKTE